MKTVTPVLLKVMRISTLLHCVSVNLVHHVNTGQDCNRVTYTKRRICVLKGSSVDISCTYVGYYSVRSSLWFSPKQSGRWRDKLKPEDLTTDPGYAGRVKNKNEKSGKKGSTLRITDLREEDSAEYRFTFKTYYLEWGHDFPGTTLTVTDVVLEMPTSVSEGNRVTLTCTTNCSLDPNPEYSWYKNGQPIENTNTNSTVHILSVSSEDAGRYSCGVKGHETLLSPEKTLDVTYGPKYTSVSLSPSGEIVVGSSVTLTCSSDANPPVNKYTWYKKTVTSPKASGQNYNITNIRPEDSGEYYCEAENKYGRLNSFSVSVDVHYGPRNTSVLISPSGEIVVGSSVTLTCSSDANPPVDKYIWYKKTVTSPIASGQSYSITNITSEDSGEYYCEAHNRKGTNNSTALIHRRQWTGEAVRIDYYILKSWVMFHSTLFLTLSLLCSFTLALTFSLPLQSVHSDPDSDTYTTLNMKTRSPEYDTLVVNTLSCIINMSLSCEILMTENKHNTHILPLYIYLPPSPTECPS
uniref:Ig-like domain-containing protein n=1 Tax=Esox lucius TaxID=8010 RepID=A0A3P8YTZ4_ESOLU